MNNCPKEEMVFSLPKHNESSWDEELERQIRADVICLSLEVDGLLIDLGIYYCTVTEELRNKLRRAEE